MKVVWNTSQVWTKLFLGAQLFGRAILLERTIGQQKNLIKTKASFGGQFKKSHEKLKRIFFQSHVNDLDQSKYSKFSYCYTGLSAKSQQKRNA